MMTLSGSEKWLLSFRAPQGECGALAPADSILSWSMESFSVLVLLARYFFGLWSSFYFLSSSFLFLSFLFFLYFFFL